MAETEKYINLINDILSKQTIILGADIVLLKARNILGLHLNAQGHVESIDGDPQQVLENLVSEYMSLSGQVTKNALATILAKYPEIKISIN